MRLYAKVAVIGGGPAGATASRVLAAHGVEVILLERNLSFSKPCGGGLILSAFNEFGIPDRTIKRKVTSIRLISPRGETATIGLGDEGIAIVQRGEFDTTLREKAAEEGVRIIEGEFEAINPGNPCVITARVGCERADIVAETVIAADGVNSSVRKALRIRPPSALFAVSEHILETREDVCEFWLGSEHAPGLYSWIFPACEGISIGTGSFEPGQLQTLFEKFKIRIGMRTKGQRRTYRLPAWTGDLYCRNNVLFAGDSAGQVLPLTYEGIYYAMKSGELAALSIIEGKGDRYEDRWKKRFHKRFVLMDKLRDHFLKDDNTAEELVALHKRSEIQRASLLLWLKKDSSTESFLNYFGIFRKFLS